MYFTQPDGSRTIKLDPSVARVVQSIAAQQPAGQKVTIAQGKRNPVAGAPSVIRVVAANGRGGGFIQIVNPAQTVSTSGQFVSQAAMAGAKVTPRPVMAQTVASGSNGRGSAVAPRLVNPQQRVTVVPGPPANGLPVQTLVTSSQAHRPLPAEKSILGPKVDGGHGLRLGTL